MANSRYNDEQSGFRIEDSVGADDLGPIQTAIAAPPTARGNEGPCLYLGPAGQRCYQRAVKGGFCAAHQPGVTARAKIGKRGKLLAAIAGIAGVVWPYVYDFIRELIRIFHPH
jgi:hypothetical protein